jgi:precorrin-6Y C5,15-methyltransferase (decarboxylating)
MDDLSHAARRALAQAELVVGGRRHLGLVGRVEAETLAWASPIEATFPAILARRGRAVCILASGDPFCFGVGSTLACHLPVAEMRCYPRPSAFSLAASRLGWAQQDCVLMSCCGRPVEALIPALHPGARLIVLSADASTPAMVARLLTERGFGPSRLIVCEAMGGPRERLREMSAEGFAAGDIDPLNTIAIEVLAGSDARLPSLVPGRPDTGFETDGQITRREIRAVTLAKLAPRPGETLWDVGAGSGSVSIEWMLAHPSNRAIAVEREAERAARIARNAAIFGVPGLDVVEGMAPAALASLPSPHAIFIGGGGTEPGVADACLAALPAGGRLVVNAVTIETQALLVGLHGRHGGSLTLLQVGEAVPVGSFHGFRPAMPVMQWAWVKP